MDIGMTSRLTQLLSCTFILSASLFLEPHAVAQSDERGVSEDTVVAAVSVELPEAPRPQGSISLAEFQAQSSASSGGSPDTASSAAQTSPATGQQKTQQELAEEQLQQQKKQRALGFLPSFNTSYNDAAVPLTAKQKFKLAFTSATDPVQFGLAGFVALIGQAEGSDYEYGGGIGGYGKRFGADYADAFDGAMLGNALFPALLHQDPRFFRRGYGSKKSRVWYALTTSVICRHDGKKTYEPNYSNILGNLAAGGISNLYAPENERGVGNTFEGAALVTIEGGAGAILQEFWPDISRHFFHKDPTNGQDAINNRAHSQN
jgi:hypothetical protein